MASQIKVGDIVYVRATGMLVVVTGVDGGRVSFIQAPFSANIDEVTLVFLQEDIHFDIFAHDEFVKLLESFLRRLVEISELRQRIENLIEQLKNAHEQKDPDMVITLRAQLRILNADFIKLVDSSEAVFDKLSQAFGSLPNNADSLVAMFERVQILYDAEDTSTPECPNYLLEDVATLTNPRKNTI